MGKQLINQCEPYFVHIGFTFANELKKTKLKVRGSYKILKTKPSLQKRLEKLKRYWKRSLL